MGLWVLESTDLPQDKDRGLAGSCKQDNKPSDAIEGGKFPE